MFGFLDIISNIIYFLSF